MRDFLQKVSIHGMESPVKPCKLLNVPEHIGNERDSFKYYCFDIPEAVAFQMKILFLTHRPVA